MQFPAAYSLFNFQYIQFSPYPYEIADGVGIGQKHGLLRCNKTFLPEKN
jgi:hypothetical protein